VVFCFPFVSLLLGLVETFIHFSSNTLKRQLFCRFLSKKKNNNCCCGCYSAKFNASAVFGNDMTIFAISTALLVWADAMKYTHSRVMTKANHRIDMVFTFFFLQDLYCYTLPLWLLIFFCCHYLDGECHQVKGIDNSFSFSLSCGSVVQICTYS
jgi:hypothetical protein